MIVVMYIAMVLTGLWLTLLLCGPTNGPIEHAATFFIGTFFAWLVWVWYAFKLFGWTLKNLLNLLCRR